MRWAAVKLNEVLGAKLPPSRGYLLPAGLGTLGLSHRTTGNSLFDLWQRMGLGVG